MSEDGPRLIGLEILRVDAEWERAEETGQLGKERRKRLENRRAALMFSLHAVLTEDTTRLPGKEVEAFLEALRGGEEAPQAAPPVTRRPTPRPHRPQATDPRKRAAMEDTGRWFGDRRDN
ncbi:hypothetical protein ABZ905_36995 [Streptomyces parvus]|uniref:hypothetical protein n=1 Tax=Streptomyces parvus TaxID=66428 RepID=UPI0033E40285